MALVNYGVYENFGHIPNVAIMWIVTIDAIVTIDSIVDPGHRYMCLKKRLDLRIVSSQANFEKKN